MSLYLSEDAEIRTDDLLFALGVAWNMARDEAGLPSEWTDSERKRISSLRGLMRWMGEHRHEAREMAEWMSR